MPIKIALIYMLLLFFSHAFDCAHQVWKFQSPFDIALLETKLFKDEHTCQLNISACFMVLCISFICNTDCNFCFVQSGSSLGSFTFGIWSESHDVLGVVDDTDILYFIKANGEEITKITKKHLKVALPIMGLIVHDSSDMNKSCL